MSEGPFRRDTEHENIPEEMRKSLRNEYFLNDWSSRTIHFSLILFFFVFLFFVYLFIYLFFFSVFFLVFCLTVFVFCWCFFLFLFFVFCFVVFVFLFVCLLLIFVFFNGQLCCFRVVARKCVIEKVFFKVSQNLLDSTCAAFSFFNNIVAWRPIHIPYT